jgi:hypothetical protein
MRTIMFACADMYNYILIFSMLFCISLQLRSPHKITLFGYHDFVGCECTNILYTCLGSRRTCYFSSRILISQLNLERVNFLIGSLSLEITVR